VVADVVSSTSTATIWSLRRITCEAKDPDTAVIEERRRQGGASLQSYEVASPLVCPLHLVTTASRSNLFVIKAQ
jgi:hypothetical protein